MMKTQPDERLVATKVGGHSVVALGVLSELPKFRGCGASRRADVVVFTDSEDFQEYDVPVFETVKWRSFGKSFSFTDFLKNFFDSLDTLLTVFPDEVYCCGANNSLFVGFLGKLFGAKVIAVEANNRVSSPSKTPRILSYVCDEVWVPNEQLVGKYRGKAVYKGFVHPVDDFSEFESSKDIEELNVVSSSEDSDDGLTGVTHERLLEKLGRTKKLVARGGMTAWEGAHLCDKVVVCPIKDSDENHQVEFAEWLVKKFDNVEVDV